MLPRAPKAFAGGDGASRRGFGVLWGPCKSQPEPSSMGKSSWKVSLSRRERSSRLSLAALTRASHSRRRRRTSSWLPWPRSSGVSTSLSKSCCSRCRSSAEHGTSDQNFARAASQVRRAAEWWAQHRPAAPGAVGADFGEAVALLAEQPGIGAKYEGARAPGVRRLFLGRIGYFVAPGEAAPGVWTGDGISVNRKS